MSVNRNFTRTLSGANSFTIDNLELSSHRNTIRINGNSGNAGDVLGKDVNNRLVFTTLAPFIIDPNSIDGSKLKDNISITTTGNYNGNSITLTGDLQVNNNVNIDGNLTYAGDLNIDDLVVDSLTLDPDFVGNGNINLNQHEIVGNYANLNINGNTGSIVCFQLVSKDSVLVEDTLSVVGDIDTSGNIDLTTGNITLDSGNIELTAGNIIASAGDIECVDLETTGEITGGDDITITGDYSSTNGNITLTNGNISVVDNTATNGFFDTITLPKTGSAVITLSSSNGNIETTGNFTTTAGNVETTSGNIFTTNGDIHANNGYIRGDVLRFLTKLQLGDTLTPTLFIDSNGLTTGSGHIISSHTGSYASNDFALELTEANSHAKIGGNLKVDGTIFGNIEGDVSENHINGQSLRIHDLGSAGDTGIQVEDGYDIRMYSDAGTTKTIELDSSSGDITITGTLFGNVEGGISEDHINGQSLIIENLGVAGDTGIEIHDGYDISTFSDSGTTKTFAIDGATGNYSSNSGNILLSNGNLTVDDGDVILNKIGSKPAPEDNTYTDFALDLTDTNTHARIGGNLIVDGKIYGDLIGDITDEIINAQKINLREATPPDGAFIGLEITDTATNDGEISMRDDLGNYNFRVYGGGNVDIANAIIWNGSIFNNVNDGTIVMNDGMIRSINTTTSKLDLDFDTGSAVFRNGTLTNNLMTLSNTGISIRNPDNPLVEATSITDTEYRLNDSTNNSGNARVIIDSVNGISLLTGSNVYNLTLSPAGNISWSNDSSGEIIGRDAGVSGSNDENTTNMRNIRIDESCFKYDTREIAISKPTSRIERTFSSTSTAWSDINDNLFVSLKTNNRTNTSFIVEWSYYAVKDNGTRMWAKLFDVDASSPADADQPTYLNNTKQVFYDGATGGTSVKPSQHTVTFTMRNVSANVDKNIGVCVWFITTGSSYIRFYLGPASYTGDPPADNKLSSYAFGGMTLQIKKMYDGGVSNSSPSDWSASVDTDTMIGAPAPEPEPEPAGK